MIPYEFDAERLSRWMAYALRHNPMRYGLQPDRHGYVDFSAFVSIVKQRYPNVTMEQLRGLIESSGAGRFELSGERLRARYGHSIPVEPSGPTITPPARLYHGTEQGHVEHILTEGLKPRDRQLLHLSETLEDALAVAQRKTTQPAVVRIDATRAAASGVSFYREGKVYLTAQVPAIFLSLESVPDTLGTGSTAS